MGFSQWGEGKRQIQLWGKEGAGRETIGRNEKEREMGGREVGMGRSEDGEWVIEDGKRLGWEKVRDGDARS